MPRDAQGNASLVPGYLAVTGQTILASQHNPPLEDIASMISGSLARNGTGGMQNNLYMGGFSVVGMANGAYDDAAATVAQVNLAAPPIGAVLDYAGGAAPSGYLLCSGQEVSRATYAALFNVISTAYGAGNGTTTFNVPDLRGRVVAGMDNMGGFAAGRLTNQPGGVNGLVLGGGGGVEIHTLLTAQMPAHAHSGTTSTDGAHTHPLNGQTIQGGSNLSPSALTDTDPRPLSTVTQSAGAHSHTFTTANEGGGGAHNNVQPTMIMNKIIRAL